MHNKSTKCAPADETPIPATETALEASGGIQTTPVGPESQEGPLASPCASSQPAAEKPRCAVYLRVSTSEQTTAGQKPDISALVAARGYAVVETYQEQASAVKHRPEMERLMADAAAGKFSVVVVWALDRFGRSLQGNINAILALDGLGVTVVSVREPWLDTAGPVRGLLVAIFSWVAQQERTRLIERTKAGIAVARAGGVKWGRKSVATLLLPGAEAERDRVMAKWDAGGQIGGFKTLGVLLGGCSHNTARRLWEKARTNGPRK